MMSASEETEEKIAPDGENENKNGNLEDTKKENDFEDAENFGETYSNEAENKVELSDKNPVNDDFNEVNLSSTIKTETIEPPDTKNSPEKESSENNNIDTAIEVPEINSKAKEEKGNSEIEATARNFKNSFFEVVEELKLRKTLDSENEARITSLMTEKNEMHRQWDEEVSRNGSLRDMYEKREVDVAKQFEEKLRQFETNKAKYEVSQQCSDKEIVQLKEEIRVLRLAKHNIEKRASDLERELHLHTIARENHVKQLAEIEKKQREAFKQADDILGLLDEVERNVGAANRLHRKLTYSNEHQNCQLNACKQSLEEKQKELAHFKVIMENHKALLSTYESSNRTNDNSEKELKMQTELCRQLQSLLDEAKEENKNLLESLKEAQTLVDRHVDAVKKHSELEAMAHFELDEVKSECEEFKNQLQEAIKSYKKLLEEMEEKREAWNSEKEEKDRHLNEVKEQLDALALAQNSLEETNGKLSEQKEQLISEIDDMRANIQKSSEDFNETKNQLLKQIEDKDFEIRDLASKLTKEQSEGAAQSSACQQWKEKYIEMEENLKESSGALSEVQKDNFDLKETNMLLEKRICTFEDEVVNLRLQLDDAKSQTESQSKSALQWKDKVLELEGKLKEQMVALEEKKKVVIESFTQTEDGLVKETLQKIIPIKNDEPMQVLQTVNETNEPLSSTPSNNLQSDQMQVIDIHSEKEDSSSNTNLNETMENDTGGTTSDNSANHCIKQSHLPISGTDEDKTNEQESTTDSGSTMNAQSCEAHLVSEKQDAVTEETTVLKSCLSKRPRAEGPPKKRVRFNISDKQSSIALPEKTEETAPVVVQLEMISEEDGETDDSLTLNDWQELFSDEDDEITVVKFNEIGKQISQVQHFLDSERLKTIKRRKIHS